MANEAEQAIYTRLASAPTFHPVTADLFVDDWGLDAGDIVTVRSGETDYSVPIYNMSLDWRGSAMAQIQSTGNKERKPLSALKRKEFRSGRSGYNTQKEIDHYETDFIRDRKNIGMFARAIGVQLDENGDPIIDPETGDYVWDDENGAEIYSRLVLSPNRAELVSAINDGAGNKISGAKIDVSAQGAVLIEAINNRPSSQSSVVIRADRVNLEGMVTATQLDTRLANIDTLFTRTGYAGTIYAENVSATNTVSGKTGDFTDSVYAQHYYVTNSAGDTDYQLGNSVTAFGSTASDPTTGHVSIPYYTNAHPWGSSSPAGNITFNIADMAFYQNHIGISSTGSWTWDAEAGSGEGAYVRTITPKAGNAETIDFPAVTASAGITYNPMSHTYSATAVAKYGGRDVSAVDSAPSGLEAYYGGKSAVSLSSTLSWTTTPAAAISVAQNAVTVSTSGRTNSSGTASESTKTINLYSQGSTSGLTATFYVTQSDSTDANRIIKRTATCSDSNLTAGNIKNGVSIFGVTGTYQGSTGGISTMTISSGMSTEPSADYSGGTLSANSWYTVTATPNSGNAKVMKFKTPANSGGGSSANIDLQVKQPQNSAPSKGSYSALVYMRTLTGLIDLWKNNPTAKYIPIEATAPGCTGTKLYYVVVGGD